MARLSSVLFRCCEDSARTAVAAPARFLQTRTLGLQAGLRTLAVASLPCCIVAVFCCFLLQHDPSYFWQDDYQSYQLAGLYDVVRACSEGEIPLLSPFSWQAGALAAEYQYGVFSVFLMAGVLTVFALGCPLPIAAAGLSIIHLVVLATGAFFLGRSRKLSIDLSLLVALVTTLSGWIFCWGARCWFPALASFAWLPWFWWSLQIAQRAQHGLLRFLPAGIFLYLIISAGWPFTVLMSGLLSFWFLLRIRFEEGAFRPAWPLLAAWIVGLGLSAPAWLMLLEYTPWTLRGEVSPWWLTTEWSVPFGSLPGLVFPFTISQWDVFGTTKPHANLELAGGLVPLAILLAALGAKPQLAFRRLGWEFGLCLVLLVLSLLPSLGNFRWSFRWLPFFFLVLAVLAAEALASVRERRDPANRNRARTDPEQGFANSGVWAVRLMSGAWLLALCADRDPTYCTLVLGGALMCLCVLWAAVDHRSCPYPCLRTWMPCLVVLISSGLTHANAAPFAEVPSWTIDRSVLQPAALDPHVCYLSVYLKSDIVARDDGRVRATYGKVGRGVELMPGNLAMYSATHFVNGYSPLRPDGLAKAIGLDWHGFLWPDAAEELLAYETQPDGLLEMMAVDGLVVADRFASHYTALESNGWHRVAALPGRSVFHRNGPPSRRVRTLQEVAWVADPQTTARRPAGEARPFVVRKAGDLAPPAVRQFAAAKMDLLRESRNAVEVAVEERSADAATFVAFSRPWYPGYEATFNGRPVPVHRLNRMMPAVELPPGPGGVLILKYRPRSLVLGCGIAGGTCAAVGLLLLGAVLQRAKNSVSPQTESSIMW